MKQQITKNAIENSFLQLLSDKPFDKITVRDIVEDCGLTRNAFYYYYDDIYAIIEDILERNVESILSKIKTGEISWEETLCGMAEYAEGHKKFIYHLYKSPKKDELKRCFSEAAKQIFEEYADNCVNTGGVSSEDREIILNHFEYVVYGITCNWLSKGMNYSLSGVIRREVSIFRDSVAEAFEVARKNPQ